MFKSLSTFTHRVSGQRCHFLSAAALPLLPPVFLSSPPPSYITRRWTSGSSVQTTQTRYFDQRKTERNFWWCGKKNPKIYERAFTEKPLIVQRKCVELYARKPEANPLTLSHQRILGSVWHPSTEVVFFNPLNMNVLFSNFSLGGKKNIIISYK